MTTRRPKTISRYRSQAGIVYDILNTIAEEGPNKPDESNVRCPLTI